MNTDSPRQLTAEAGIPWASSVTTLSRSGSSYSHVAHTLGSDPKQEIHLKHALAVGFVRRPFETAVKQMAPEQVLYPSSDPKQESTPKQSTIAGSVRRPIEAAAKQIAPEQTPNPSSDYKQETIPKHTFVAGSVRSPFEAAAKQTTPEHIPQPVCSPFETTSRSRLQRLASDFRTAQALQMPLTDAQKAKESA